MPPLTNLSSDLRLVVSNKLTLSSPYRDRSSGAYIQAAETTPPHYIHSSPWERSVLTALWLRLPTSLDAFQNDTKALKSSGCPLTRTRKTFSGARVRLQLLPSVFNAQNHGPLSFDHSLTPAHCPVNLTLTNKAHNPTS